VLDDVERRRFLVEPARENPVPALVRTAHVNLDEGAGQLLFLPRRGRFAGAKADDDVLPADRLARTKSDVLDDSVALVEDSEDGDPLRHRRHSALPRGRCRHFRPRHARILLGILAASGQRERDQQGRGKPIHSYSGIHGS
jgi:hypothetical protein